MSQQRGAGLLAAEPTSTIPSYPATDINDGPAQAQIVWQTTLTQITDAVRHKSRPLMHILLHRSNFDLSLGNNLAEINLAYKFS